MNVHIDAPQVNIDAELLEATKRAEHPEIADALARFNLARHREAVGLDYVVIEGQHYRPDFKHGEPAFIVECVEQFRLIDLVACTLTRRRTATRIGRAWMVGWVWMTRAIANHERRIILHTDVLKWMHRGFVGAVVLDWARGAAKLLDVPVVLCDSEDLAHQVYGACSVLGRPPRIDVFEPRHD